MDVTRKSSYQGEHKQSDKRITKSKIQLRIVLHAENISHDKFKRNVQESGNEAPQPQL